MQSFSINFYVKKTKLLKDGSMPIYVRVTVSSQSTEFAIKLSVKPEMWDSHKNLMKGFTLEAKKTNDSIHKVRAQIMQIAEEIHQEGTEITATRIKQRYFGEDVVQNATIVQIFEEHNRNVEQLIGKDFTKDTYTKYVRLLRQMREFMKYKYGVKDMPIDEINPKFVSDFTVYIRTVCECDNNTCINKLKGLKKITRIALANGWIQIDPFKDNRFRFEEVDVDYLTEDELEIISKKEFAIQRLQQVKDIYVFCCYTGLAYIDVKELQLSNIKTHKSGKQYIEKRRHKTNVMSTIPLFKPAIDIIEKYKNHPVVEKEQCVLPVLSNQKSNAYLKEIADLCGINKRLTTHTARHTFATTVALPNGLSLDITAKIIGHSTTKLTSRYARITSDLILNSTNHIYDKLGNVGI